MRNEQRQNASAKQILVWDRGVRMFHWLLVVTVTGSLISGFLAPRHWLDLHVILGTCVAALLTFRIVWGLTGSTYARFSSFIVSPRQVLRHGGEALRGMAPRHIGHNPLGGAMVVALLLVLTTEVVVGVTALGGVIKEGPLAPFATYAAGALASLVHRILGFAMIGLIAVHITGAVVESVRTRENLIRAMIDGRKREAGSDQGLDCYAVLASVPARPAVTAIVLAGIAMIAGPAVAYLSLLPALGVPTAIMDTSYAKECGACHTAHHPSLATTATWTRLMAGLDDHFGENASLDEAESRRLSGYLMTHAAERWDTAASQRLRLVNPREPLRITGGDGWRAIHRSVPTETFATKSVAGKLNCSNCHRDSQSGRFAPRAIQVPEQRNSP